MAERSELVKHSILSLAATYMLDFGRNNASLQAKALHHHSTAVDILGKELSNMEIQTPGKEEEVVAALLLLAHNEVHRPKSESNVFKYGERTRS